MSEFRTAGVVRRGLSLSFDALFGVAFTVAGYALGLFDATPFHPPPDWFWTEWWLKHWLDAPSVFVVPVVSFAIATLLWVATWEATTGRTPGDRLAGLRVIDAAGERPNPLRIALRTLGMMLNVASLGLGWLWIVVSPCRRGWHDLLSGTWTALNADTQNSRHP
jgi:uncharacterized RDD family membrane protein YckC